MPTIKYKDPVTGEYKSDIHVVGAVSSVNGKTGVVELTNSDITDAITDVQINGASVVTDGVANVPQELFTVVYNSTTFSEITDAVNAGKLPVCMNNGILYRYVKYIANSVHYFQSMEWSAAKPSIRYFVVTSTDSYTANAQSVALTSDVPTMAKTAITSPVSTQYPAWTAEEQTNARARIGVQDGVSDVQINGTSVVVDGVANVPMANSSTAGVIFVQDAWAGFGVRRNENGYIYVARATNDDINSRSSIYVPVVPNNLDYAVKAAMCDGKGAAWTATEQAAAQQRLGINKNWTLKATITDGSETPIDLTGCTELVVVTSITATGTCNLKFGDYYIVNGIGYNGSRTTYSRFADGVVGMECVTSKQTNSFSVALEGSCNGNTYVNGLKISDITSLRVAGTASLINVNIYAR